MDSRATALRNHEPETQYIDPLSHTVTRSDTLTSPVPSPCHLSTELGRVVECRRYRKPLSE
jgi:hypothetical protein